ncbi:DinB family protein [Streptomyces sp. NPDC052687]|uniref:DinB family protein n=1 Tax=Streptomyces sp. NPDC052687 TaxID=3154759 RepID=UPI003441E7CC
MHSPRPVPPQEQSDFACERLTGRLAGPVVDSGDGTPAAVGPMTDGEYVRELVPGCRPVRRRSAGPGARATAPSGAPAGERGRDTAPYPHPAPSLTTIARRLTRHAEMPALRADHTPPGGRTLTRDDHRVRGDAAALNTVGHRTYPHGGDAGEPFVGVVWSVRQELPYHGAQVALLRDLFRARRD